MMDRMFDRMMKYLARIEPRRVPLFAAAFVVLVAGALGSYLVLPQYQAQRAAAGEQLKLEQTVEDAQSLTEEQALLYADVERLELALHSDANGLSQQALEAFVIDRLQDIAWRRDLEFVSIQPLPGGRIGAIRETLFELEVVGEWSDLQAWLGALHTELAAVVVRDLSLTPLDQESSAPRLRAALIVAAYGSTA